MTLLYLDRGTSWSTHVCTAHLKRANDTRHPLFDVANVETYLLEPNLPDLFVLNTYAVIALLLDPPDVNEPPSNLPQLYFCIGNISR